jgi:hypothetical protein
MYVKEESIYLSSLKYYQIIFRMYVYLLIVAKSRHLVRRRHKDVTTAKTALVLIQNITGRHQPIDRHGSIHPYRSKMVASGAANDRKSGIRRLSLGCIKCVMHI